MVVNDEKKRKFGLWARIAMDFEPKSSILHGQEVVDEYLERYHGPLSIGTKMEWCPSLTDVRISPHNMGVYFHPQILALGVKFLLTYFIRKGLAFYNVAPTQLTPSAWRTILGYEALCDLPRFLIQSEGFLLLYDEKTFTRDSFLQSAGELGQIDFQPS